MVLWRIGQCVMESVYSEIEAINGVLACHETSGSPQCLTHASLARGQHSSFQLKKTSIRETKFQSLLFFFNSNFVFMVFP